MIDLPQGAQVVEGGVRYRTWAPEADRVDAMVGDLAVPLALDAAGIWSGIDPQGTVGDRYKFRLYGHNTFPDMASRYQPDGVHGASMVIDPRSYQWSDRKWKCPALRDLVIYELHIGTFTAGGTFRDAIERLDHIRDLGANAIEIMPVADFAGNRGWGYDGVMIYAPARCYGHPDDLRALVDAAHARDLAVLLDVVYNHFGPDGNYLGAYSPHWFNKAHKTPWGDAFNFDGEHHAPVRAFFLANPLYWMDEFHIDGFRFDAIHAIPDDSPRHILQEMTDAIHARGGIATAEDPRNEARLALPSSEGGTGFDGLWADDFHHSIRVRCTDENEAYYENFTGSLDELIDTLRHGWHYRGQITRHGKTRRGTECRHLPPERFIHCISNHDQTGNQAFGKRLGEWIDPAQYRAASALLCLSPYTPMLFMGQEWGASTPFAYFTDHHEELGRLVTKGRREEFRHFRAFSDPASVARIPDPQAESTFVSSKLDWSESRSARHEPLLSLYDNCLRLRADFAAFRPASRETWQVEKLDLGAGAIRYKNDDGDWLLIFSLAGTHRGLLADEWMAQLPEGRRWVLELSSNEQRFGGAGMGFDEAAGEVVLTGAEVLVLRT